MYFYLRRKRKSYCQGRKRCLVTFCNSWFSSKYMTGSGKTTVLSPMSADLIFHFTQRCMNKLLNSTFKTSHTGIVCFCWLIFWSTVTIYTSSLENKWRSGQPVDGCEWLHSSVVLNKNLYCKFQPVLRLEWPIGWLNASLHLLIQSTLTIKWWET